MIAVRRATPADASAAAATLTAAFETYPWTVWSIPGDRYLERLERLQTLYLTHTLEHGVVLVTEDLSGVTALLPPGSPEPSEDLQSEVVELMGDRLAEVASVRLPPRLENSWDFATLGVLPSMAGRGLGSLFIRESIDVVAKSNAPRLSLETSSERNVALYERHGFVTTNRTETHDGPPVFTMGLEC